MEFWAGLGFVNLPLKRFYKYILKRLIGGFLRHDIDLEQLDVQLYRGIVQLKTLELDVAQLNLAALGAGLLLHFVSGLVGCIKMDVPWRHLLRDPCKVYISGVEVVLAKGMPDVAGISVGPQGSIGAESPMQEPPESEAAGPPVERPSRYSDEGIETLSRLVKNVLSRLELCIHDAQLSVRAPPARSALRARLASAVVFSERLAEGGAEERAVRVAGVSLALVPMDASTLEACLAAATPATSLVDARRSGESEELLLFASTDCDAAPPDVLQLRRVGRGSTGAAALGVHLDVELSLHCLRFVLAPALCRVLAECLASLGEPPPREALAGDELQGGLLEDPSQISALQRSPLMVQSLMESSFRGNPSAVGFWHELYNLFEADAQLEDAAADPQGQRGPGEAEAAVEEDVGLDEQVQGLGPWAASEAESAHGPVLACTVRVRVTHICGLLVLGEAQRGAAAPRPTDVPLLPRPCSGVDGDHAQLCVDGWAGTFERRALGSAVAAAIGPLAVTALAQSAAVHLHRCCGGTTRPCLQEVDRAANESCKVRGDLRDGAAHLATSVGTRQRVAPEEFIIHSQTEEGQTATGRVAASSSGGRGLPSTSPSQAELDAMFCSALSRAAVEPSQEQLARGAQTPEAASCRCSTTESLGEVASEDEDSFLHSAASSVRSMGDSSEMQGLKVRRAGSAEAASAATAATAMAAPAPSAGSREGARSSWEAEVEAAEPARATGESAEEPEEREEAETREEEPEEEAIEALFFDRSRPLRDALLSPLPPRRPGVADMGAGLRGSAGGGTLGSAATAGWRGWYRTVPDFETKRILHFVSLSDRAGNLTHGNATGSTAEPRWEPALTLPPPGHPLWDGLRLVGDGGGGGPADAAAAAAVAAPGTAAQGHQLRAEWAAAAPRGGSAALRAQPAGTVECQPVVLSLCADSIRMLSGGAAWLQDLAAVPPPQLLAMPAAASKTAAECGGTRRLVETFALVTVAPLIRVELVLGATHRGDGCLVGDLVIPRVFSQRQGDVLSGPRVPDMPDSWHEEAARLELEEFRLYLRCTGSDGGPAARCVELLTVAGHAQDTRGPGLLRSGTCASCSIFRRVAAPFGLELSAFPSPPSRRPEEEEDDERESPAQVPRPAAGGPPRSAWSEWTKISVPPLAPERGRGSRSSLVLQDLRHASQRLLRPGQGTRIDYHRSSASLPPCPRVAWDRGDRETQTRFPERAHDGGLSGGEAADVDISLVRRGAEEGVGRAGGSMPGSRRRGPSALRPSRAASVEAPRTTEGSDGHKEGSTCKARVELELSLPGTLRAQADALSCVLLQEAFAAFAGRLGELTLEGPEALRELLEPSNEVQATLACTLTVGSLLFRLLETESRADEGRATAGAAALGASGSHKEEAEDGGLQVRLAPVTCRLVQSPGSDFRLHCACQDVRLEDTCLGRLRCRTVRTPAAGDSPMPPEPEPLIRPWFRPALRPAAREATHEAASAARFRGTTAGIVSTAVPGYPWDLRRARARVTAVQPTPADVDQGLWRETHSLLIQVEQSRCSGVDHQSVSVKANRLALLAHPHLRPAYLRLLAFLECSGSGANLAGRPASAPLASLKVSLLDCLVDLPSEAHDRACLSRPPDLQELAAHRGPAEAEGEEWRAVAHVHGLELALGGEAQGPEVTLSECTLLLVDQAGHLSHSDLTTAFAQPVASLSGLGFAHVLELHGATVALRGRPLGAGGAAPRGAASTAAAAGEGESSSPFGRSWHSCEVSVHEISGHLCADTVKCLLYAGMELVEMVPQAEAPPSSALLAAEAAAPLVGPSLAAAAPLQAASATTSQAMPAAAAEEEEAEAPECGVVERHASTEAASSTSVSILENIDMFAFEPAAAPSAASETPTAGRAAKPTPSSPSAAVPLESCLIDDYIRAQERQQSPRLPVRASACAAAAEGTIEGRRTVEGEEEGSSSVAVCLFDPEAFPEGQLRELCAQDQSARLEVERLYEQNTPPPSSSAAAAGQQEGPPEELRADPSLAAGGGAAGQPHEVLHQDGSAAVWFVDPAEVQVVADHFVQWADPEEDRRFRPPPQAPPVQLTVTFHCGTAGLSLYSGTDFEGDGRERLQASEPTGDAAAGPSGRRRQAHLTLQLRQSLATMMMFEMSTTSSGSRSGSAFKRRFMLCARDVDVLDHVPGSVFSHLLSYFEDERRRPRPSHADMLRLVLDEVLSPAGAAGTGAGDGAVAAEVPEYMVELQLLPLRLTIDQDVVDFLLDFVQLCTLPSYVEEEPREQAGGSPASASAGGLAAEEPSAPASAEGPPPGGEPASPAAAAVREPFFQRVSVGPLLVSVDYRAKRLDVDALRRGDLWELINLLPLLEGLQIAFRSVTVTGASGLNQLTDQVVSAWSTDLNRTQILRSLTGVTPIRSFANIGGGFAEMVLEPLKQYRTGGGSQRVSRTILRGLVSFLKHVTVESIDLTERIFVGTQSALECVSSCLREEPHATPAGGGSRAVPGRIVADDAGEGAALARTWTAVERGAADFLQPGGAAEGLEQACASLTRGVRHAGQAVVVRPLLELHRGAPRNQVLRSVVTGIPMCVLQPAIGATEAATTALRGVRNSVDPLHRREIVQKYKGPE